jgi:hypothetical protein
MSTFGSSFGLLLLASVLAVSGFAPARAQGDAAKNEGTLLAVTVDRGDLPADQGFFILGRDTVAPDTRYVYPSNPDVIGFQATIVESGVLTYELEGPGVIWHGADTTAPTEENAPVATPFTLEPGDVLVTVPKGGDEPNGSVVANEGNEPAIYLWAVVLAPVPPPPDNPDNVGEIISEELARDTGGWLDLAPGPIDISVRETTVAAGAHLASLTGGMQTVAQTSGEPGSLLMGGDGAAINLGQESVDALVLSIAPAGATEAPAAEPSVESTTPSGSAPDLTVEKVATVPLLAAAMPQHPAVFDTWMSSYEPGDDAEYPSYEPALTIAADIVLTGDYAAQSAGRMQVDRGATIEEVTPNTEVTIGPGESVIYVENAAAQKVRNPGDTTANLISFGVFSVAPPNHPFLGVVKKDDWAQSGLAEENLAVAIERLTLPPGASLPLYEPDVSAPRIFAIEQGDLDWTVVPAVSADEPVATLHFRAGQVIPFRALRPGQQLALSNTGEEPLTMLELTLSPDEGTAIVGTPIS